MVNRQKDKITGNSTYRGKEYMKITDWTTVKSGRVPTMTTLIHSQFQTDLLGADPESLVEIINAAAGRRLVKLSGCI